MEGGFDLVGDKADREPILRARKSCQNCENLAKWRTAWIALVQEIQRYGGGVKWPTVDAACELARSTADDLRNAKLNLLKRVECEETRTDIRIVWEMHTRLLSDEKKAVGSLKCNLGDTSTELISPARAARQDETIVTKLKLENRLLSSKLQNLTEIMRIGYRELCKFLDEPGSEVGDLPPTLILREIINKSSKHYIELQDTVKEIKLLRQTCVGMQNKLREATAALEDSTRKNLQLEADYLLLTNSHTDNDVDINNKHMNRGNSIIATYDQVFPAEINHFQSRKNNVFVIRSKQSYVSVLQTPIEQLKAKEILSNERQCQLSIVHSLLDKQDGLLRNLKLISEEFNCCKLERRSEELDKSDAHRDDTKSSTTVVLYPTATRASGSERVVPLKHRRERNPRVAKNTLNVLRNNSSMAKLSRLNVISLSDNCFNLKPQENQAKLYRHSC